MKIKGLAGLMALVAALYVAQAGAATKVVQGAKSNGFVYIEDQIDGGFFVSPDGTGEAVIGGTNHYINTLNYDNGGDVSLQDSLGYISTNNKLDPALSVLSDMWLDNSPVAYPLQGFICSFWFNGCESISVLQGQVTDARGFYGAEGRKGSWNYAFDGAMSDAFYSHLQQMGVNSSFTVTINECASSYHEYDASKGERCTDQSDATWYATDVTYTKSGHLRLINTNAMDEVFINSDGVPTPGEGNTNCWVQTVNGKNGLACKMVNYSLQSTGSGDKIRIAPVINNLALQTSTAVGDMQFSLDGNSWKAVDTTRPTKGIYFSNSAYFYTLNEMASSGTIYVFFSQTFFKQMVASGISDINSHDMLYFRIMSIQNSYMEAGKAFDFNSSNSLEIKPREFSINISSEDYSDAPTREGYVGRDEPSLDFNYIVTTSGKTAADEVLIKATGPTQQINGRAYCIFSADDSTIKVPFPATLSFTKQDGSIKTYDAGCDGSWRDMTDALWLTSAWTDISGEPGVMDKATVKFSIPMNDDISQKTLDNNEWYGDVSASGEIHVQATWRDIN
ncbi:TPA: fimbrial adhesin EcpD [Klebsiella aerogenes]|uniref:hypothetical protein n=1 Tax=Klebsiella TaxID=570 RepID=UPI0029287541|nr:hypothetical protein [Klebsiella sp. 141203]MDU9365819.1 hypothetical protein [Klebsiella sp. 141203]HEP0584270.1 hypothetical protein [Klebsiella aerogenes]